MAGAACKVIINMMLRALIQAVETILLDASINQGKIPETVRLTLIQRLADIDLATYTGDFMPSGGVRGIVREMQKYDLVTAEVWAILNNIDAVQKPGKNPVEG